jgi:ribosomal-protein-alanine N-acetyltransferase
MILFETDRLVLRNFDLKDVEDISEYFSNEEVARYEDFYPMTTQEIIELVNEWMRMDNRLVVVLKDINKVIGSVGYWIDEDDDYSIDFDFNPKYGKLGYATEAATKLLNYLFTELKIPKIFGDCDIRNRDSFRLLERLGFERIEQIDNESYKDDTNGDPIMISIYLYLKKNELNYK